MDFRNQCVYNKSSKCYKIIFQYVYKISKTIFKKKVIHIEHLTINFDTAGQI